MATQDRTWHDVGPIRMGMSVAVFSWTQWVLAAWGLVILLGPAPAHAEATGAEILDGNTIARNIHARDEGRALQQKMTIRLITRAGSVRTRETLVLRTEEDGLRKTAIFLASPTNAKGTAFLTWDYLGDTADDKRWLYLPASRTVRRISAADRGDSFLGTDFTYQDLQDGTKFSLTDYNFTADGMDVVDGVEAHRLIITAKTEAIARELGYSRILAFIDPESWMPVRADYWDRDGEPLKTIEMKDRRRIQGIWVAATTIATHHETGHTTELIYEDVTFNVDIPEKRLTAGALRRGF